MPENSFTLGILLQPSGLLVARETVNTELKHLGGGFSSAAGSQQALAEEKTLISSFVQFGKA